LRGGGVTCGAFVSRPAAQEKKGGLLGRKKEKKKNERKSYKQNSRYDLFEGTSEREGKAKEKETKCTKN